MSVHRLEPNPLDAVVTTSAVPTAASGGWLIRGSSVRIEHDLDAVRFYRHGWHSWGAAAWVPIDDPPSGPSVDLVGAQADDPALLTADEHLGRWVGAIEAADGSGIVLGRLGFDALVRAENGAVEGSSADDAEWFVWLGRRPRTVGPVWCTWYAYYRSIDVETVRSALEGIDGLPFEVFQIDDGWQRDIGDWTENDEFAGAMGPLADAITESGRRPGLWLAPFIAHEQSKLVEQHPEWLLSSPDGRPILAGANFGGRYHGLDLTHPEVVAFVTESVERAVTWGYTYLKLDFIFAGAMAGVRHEDVTGEEAYRQGVELIRSVVGDDVYLLACGAPIIPSIGVFDAIRVGPDVAPVWVDETNERFVRDFSIPSTRHGIATSLGRMWVNDVIVPDPDVAFFRSRRNLLDDEQRSLVQDLAAVAGFFSTSDPVGWLDPDEVEQLNGFMRADRTVTRVDRFRYRIDNRLVDFASAMPESPDLCGLCTLRGPGVRH